MDTVIKRLSRLRQLMREQGLDAYIVCTGDFHGSEYVGDYFKFREYLSGFTGSAGTLVVLSWQARLWTDGRYFLQAEAQLRETDIGLQREGCPGVPDIAEYLEENLCDHARIGFDGRMTQASFIQELAKQLQAKEITFCGDMQFSDIIWEHRPPMSKQPVWELDKKYAGAGREEKLAVLQEYLEDTGADYFVISALDDIAWLLNLRGNDVACSPVFLSYMLVGRKESTLYINREIISDELIQKLFTARIAIKPYDDIYADLQGMGEHVSLLLDEDMVNYRIVESISENVSIIHEKDPVQLLKAVKTKTECQNIKRAHIKDGIALTRFMYWLKKNIGKATITELSAAKKLEEFRKMQSGYLGESFTPIMAYAKHGAIVHYAATQDSNALLKPEGFLLADTGGHYLEGTTDVTRTFVLGPLTDREKKIYTLVLAGHLNLANAIFKYGMRGVQLDVLAREPLWREGLDFLHGTGHGVGYLLNVHEGPNSFRYRIPDGEIDSPVLEEGMLTSDEPGYYEPECFGVRHESLLLCRKAQQTEHGQFMRFDNLTMVPFDWEGIDTAYMSDREISYLDAYQKKVYETISPYLPEEEKRWLVEVTERKDDGYKENA